MLFFGGLVVKICVEEARLMCVGQCNMLSFTPIYVVGTEP